MLGRKDSFYPIDMRQEHNNAGIRVSSVGVVFPSILLTIPRQRHGPPPQGGTSWEEYSTISSVIPTMMDIVKHVEESVRGI